jgi:transcriptional regulator with XRE-family HTH domain
MAQSKGRSSWEAEMGRNLQACRLRAGLTQEQLARKARVPLGTLREWEQGRRNMRLHAAVKLADVLDLSLDELVGRRPRQKG